MKKQLLTAALMLTGMFALTPSCCRCEVYYGFKSYFVMDEHGCGSIDIGRTPGFW